MSSNNRIYCIIDEYFNIVSEPKALSDSQIDGSCLITSFDEFQKAIRNSKLEYIYVKMCTQQDDMQSVQYGKNINNIVYNTIQYNCSINRHSDNTGYTCYNFWSDEAKYLQLMEQVLMFGQCKNDRTGTGVYSLFGKSLEFDLTDNTLPLLTTKKTYFNGVLKELLWFLSGSTDAKVLNEQGVKIWNANGSLENLRSLGFEDRAEGDLGPIYGYQWRHWGRPYNTASNTAYKEVDQIKNLIDQIKMNPSSRRLIINAWNVADIEQMVLPPCHVMCQFYVNGGALSCNMYQRSADMFLGVPFNIASYALLTHMVAHVTGLKASRLQLCFGDCHVYTNHVKQVEEQLTRTPFTFPKIHINECIKSIDDFRFEHFTLHDYECHPTIKADMAV